MSRKHERQRRSAQRLRRPWVAGALATAVALGGWALWPTTDLEAAPVPITVFKSPSCGCCHGWIEHMEENGFLVTARDTERVNEIKEQQGVPAQLSSCHTALVEGYTVEGHIPADVIRELLAERPAVLGVRARGMPAGSPGMEQGGGKEPYAVLAFDRQGRTSVFARR